MTSLTGVGALVAALFIANRQPSRLGMILPLLAVAFGVMLIAFSVSTYLPQPAGLVVPLVLIAVVGAVQTSYFSLARAMMLHSAPEAMRGRVIGLLSLDRAVMTAGAAAAGFLADRMGVQPAQIVYGVICAAGGTAMYLFAREFRRTRTSHDADPAADEPTPAPSAGESIEASPAPSVEVR